MKTGLVGLLAAALFAAGAAPFAAAQGASAGGQEGRTSAVALSSNAAAPAALPAVTVVVNVSPVLTVRASQAAGGRLTDSITLQSFVVTLFFGVFTLVFLLLGWLGWGKISSIKEEILRDLISRFEKIADARIARAMGSGKFPDTADKDNSLREREKHD